jgi:hypothetical protein
VYRSLKLKAEGWVTGTPAHRSPGYVLHGNILLKNANAVYFYVPKAACSTLKKVCADNLNLVPEGSDFAETVHQLEFPHVKKYKVRTECTGYYKFAFVRNPWDRLLACYRDKITDAAGQYQNHENRFTAYLKRMGRYSPDMTFEDFVQIVSEIPDDRAEGHFRSQVTLLSDRHGLLPFDTVGRFETLSEDFEAIRKRIGLKDSLPHLRRTGSRNYRDSYSVKMRETVRKRYENDLAIFPYEF